MCITLFCTYFIYRIRHVFNHLLNIILRVQNAHIYVLLQVMKHYKYDLKLVLTLALCTPRLR